MKRIALCTLSLALVSCTAPASYDEPSLEWDGETPSHLSVVMSVEALMDHSPDGSAVVDLWSPEFGYWVEPGLDHDAIDVICPSGRVMSLEEWGSEFKISPGLWDNGVIMFSSGNASYLEEKKAPPCYAPCELELEQDGTWTCVGPGDCGPT